MNFATAALLISTVAAQAFEGSSPRASFYLQSEDLNKIEPIPQIIMIVGFAVFGIMYVFTVCYIFYDTYLRGVEFDEAIANDKAAMRDLKIDTTAKDFQDGLRDAIAGIKKEDTGDDQLFGTAVKLDKSEWGQYL